MRSFLTVCAICGSLVLTAQGVQLVNLTNTNKHSKTVFIGVENKFKILSVDGLESVGPLGVPFSLRHDTIVVRPNQVGKFTLSFCTKAGSTDLVFESRLIPGAIAAIGELTDAVVDKQAVLRAGRLRIHTFKDEDAFYEGYDVIGFGARLGYRDFLIQGNAFSSDLLSAISQAKAGEKLEFRAVKAANGAGNHFITVTQTSYELR